MNYSSLAVLMLLPALAFGGSSPQIRQMKLAAEGIETLTVHCGAGSLNLSEVYQGNTIFVNAEIEVEAFDNKDLPAYIEENMILILERIGTKAVLHGDFKPSSSGAAEARINLTVAVPSKINVAIIDGSGPIRVYDLSGNLTVDDDTGHITIANIDGNVKISDGSGKIAIEDVRGNIEIKDGSGSIDINNVKGDVRVTDGSGSLSIQHVYGNVTVTDESGSIDINDVLKNVFLREAGTGELNISRIKGKVTTSE